MIRCFVGGFRGLVFVYEILLGGWGHHLALAPPLAPAHSVSMIVMRLCMLVYS